MKPLYMLAILCALLSPFTSRAQVDWTRTQGPEGASVLTVHTAADGTIFIGTLGGGVYRSTDNADSWEFASGGLTDFDVYEIGGYAGRIYLGTLRGGVFASTDNGAHWQSLRPGVQSGRVTALIATTDAVLYATEDRELFRSTDAGQTWISVLSGPLSAVVEEFAESGGAIYAGDVAGVLHRTTDGGETWTSIDPGHGNRIDCFARLANGDVLMGTSGGVFISRDDWQTWNPMNNGLPTTWVRALLVDDRNDLYAGTGGSGIYRWNAAASEWENANANLTQDWISGFSDLPGNDLLAVLSQQTVQRWNAAQSQWTKRMQGFTAPRLYCISTDADGVMYCGGAVGNAYRSSDNGNSWVRFFEGLTGQIVNGIAPLPNGEFIIATQGDGIFHSPDGGLQWQQRNSGLGSKYLYSLYRSATGALFAGSDDGVFISRDNGVTWTAADQRFPHYTMSLAGSGSEIVAAMDSGRILLSSDDGAQWRMLQLSTTNEVVLSRRMPGGALIAAVYDEGFFVSADEGATWSLRSAQFAETYPADLLFAQGIMYFASYGEGIWRSSDYGSTWTEMNAGLPIDRMTALLRGRDRHLYACSQGAGVFRSAAPIVTEVRDVPVPADGITLLDSWPLPFADQGTIRFTSGIVREASLTVFDAAGRLVMQSRMELTAGENFFTIASSQLAPGFYQFLITAGSASVSDRFVVVR